MAKLTKAEVRLIEHPPTQLTWECTGERHLRDDGSRFAVVNSGPQEKCWLCRTPKPKRPKLLWPAYIAACKKAKIEPGAKLESLEPQRPTPTKKVTRKK